MGLITVYWILITLRPMKNHPTGAGWFYFES